MKMDPNRKRSLRQLRRLVQRNCFARWLDDGGKWLLRNFDKPRPLVYENEKVEETT